jgi:hypothetical protein
MDELNNQSLIPIYALEGAAFVGKTTVLDLLDKKCRHQVITIPEASEYVGGDKHFPSVPFESFENGVASTWFFVEIERQRTKDAIRLYRKYRLPVIIDRFTPLSSLLFYRLLKKRGTEKAEIIDQVYAHALEVFDAEIKAERIFQPTSLIHMYINDEQSFYKRLRRGTKNNDFAHWQSNVFLDNQYERIIDRYPETNVLKVESRNGADFKKIAVRKIIGFITKKQKINDWGFKFSDQSEIEFNPIVNNKKITRSRLKAKELLKQTNIRGITDGKKRVCAGFYLY